MLLPRGDRARVDDRKLLQYILSPTHAHGRTHVLLFEQLLGINLSNADVLRSALLQAARSGDATLAEASNFGTKFEIRFSLQGPRGQYTVLSVWLIESDNDSPRLVTAYIE
ncbi:MAG: DUF6883 domain-containing protein [Tepidisphaeraceae bacterium]